MKIGTKVKMINCLEAEAYRNKVWTVSSEPWDLCGTTVVKLEGFSGGFAVDFLEEVNNRTNVIKLKCIKDGEPYGRAYTYYSNVDVLVGDTVEVETKNGIVKGIVDSINVPVEEIELFKDIAKTIIGIAKKESDVSPE